MGGIDWIRSDGLKRFGFEVARSRLVGEAKELTLHTQEMPCTAYVCHDFIENTDYWEDLFTGVTGVSYPVSQRDGMHFMYVPERVFSYDVSGHTFFGFEHVPYADYVSHYNFGEFLAMLERHFSTMLLFRGYQGVGEAYGVSVGFGGYTLYGVKDGSVVFDIDTNREMEPPLYGDIHVSEARSKYNGAKEIHIDFTKTGSTVRLILDGVSFSALSCAEVVG